MVNSISQKKSLSRLLAVQAIFQMEASGQTLNKVKIEFEKYRVKTEIDGIYYKDFNVQHFRKIMDNAVKNQKIIDKKVNKILSESWKLPRIDPTLRAVFRVASSELIIYETPPKVIINEYLKLSEAFSTNEKQKGIVNAVLEKLARHFNVLEVSKKTSTN